MGNSILIIEDEEIERKALSLMLRMNIDSIDNIVEAANGIDAIKEFKQQNFDLVFVDINLPKLDGISTIKELKNTGKLTNYIIVSAIETFQYVRAALRLGVCEYLLKPITCENLLSSVNKILNSSNTLVSQDNIGDKAKKILPLIEENCIYALSHSGQEEVLLNYFEFNNFKEHNGFIVALNVDLFQKKILETIKEKLNKLGLSCMGSILYGSIILLISARQELGIKQQQTIVDIIFNNSVTLSDSCKIGVGQIVKYYNKFPSSYQGALQALSKTSEKNSIVFFRNLSNKISDNYFDAYKTKDKVVLAISSFDTSEIVKIIEEFTNNISLSNEEERNQLFRLHLLVIEHFQMELNHFFKNIISLDEFFRIKDINILSNLIIKEFLGIIDTIEKEGVCETNNLTEKALNYLSHNYKTEISLNIVADYLHISPYYLSRIIKKQTGKNFTDYLTLFRINQSKILLKEKKLSVKEITYSVGFSSQSYFSKVFKKYTGVSPTEFID